MLWECSAYSAPRDNFREELKNNFQGIDNYTEFDQLSNIDKTSYMLGSEIWEENFVALLLLLLLLLLCFTTQVVEARGDERQKKEK